MSLTSSPPRWVRAAGYLRSLPGRQWGRWVARGKGVAIRREEVWLTNRSGYRIFAEIHEPADRELRPGVLLVPGAGKSGRQFAGVGGLLGADEVAAAGYRVVRFDPVGRGQSWGHDDFCGLEGQDSCRAVLDFLHARRGVDRGRVGVVSFSMGLSLAAPVLAREGRRLGTRALIDWEGPADRTGLQALGDLPPAAQAARDDDPEQFWALREPLAFIGDLSCAYVRLQGRVDHALGDSGQLQALSLVRAAARGAAESCRLNDNAPDTAWRDEQVGELEWGVPNASATNRTLLREIHRVLAE